MTITFKTTFGPGLITKPVFETMYFPAGEAHVKLISENDRTDVGPLTQYARINTADGNELFQLAMWADAVKKREEKAILHIPYLPGARADHNEEAVFGALVYADFINNLHLDKVVVFDPHSYIMTDMIKNVEIISSTRLIRQHIVGHAERGAPQRYQGIIAPDKGAVDRDMMVSLATHLPLYRAEKVRNPDTGKLSGFTCEPLPDEGKFLVVDDICDGGGTFMGLAEAIAEHSGVGRERLGLYVSHGVFSGNAHNLWEYFSEIWTTDSLKTATNIDRPHFYDNPRARLRQYNELNVNIIKLDRTLNGYSS